MSWFSSIVHGIGGVVHDVVKGVGHAVGDVIHGVGENIVPIVAAIAAYYTAGAASAAVEGSSAAAGASGAAAAGVSDTGLTAAGAALAVVHKITAPVAEVAHYAQQFDNDIYKPIIKPLIKYYDEARTLYTAVKESLSEGWRGMLQIPTEIADAFGNLGAIERHIANLRIEGSATIASRILGPAIIDAGKGPINELTDIISKYAELPEVTLSEIPENRLNEPKNISGIIDDYEKGIDYITKLPGFVGEIARIALRILYLGPLVYEHLKQPLKEFSQNAKRENPLELLGVGDLVEAIKRDEIDVLDAVEESKKHGLDESRLNILLELSKPLLSVNESIDAAFRNIISFDEANVELKKHGYDESRRKILAELASRVPAANDTFTWFARGGIDEQTAKDLLKQAHFTDSQIRLILETGFKPVSASQYTQQFGLFEAITKGYLADTLSTKAPPDVVEAHKKQGFNAGQAQANWLGHWQDLPIRQWIDAFYRGLVTDEELDLAFTAKNIPKEIRQLNVDVERELIPIWLAPEILSAGVVTREDGHQMLAKLGLDEQNIKLILDYSDAKQNAPKFKQLDALSQLSLGNLKEMYDQGMIDESQYETGLQDHGYSAETAVLLTKSEKIKKVLRQRKEYAEGLVAQSLAGNRTKDNVKQLLFDSGFSSSEVAEYTNRIHNKRAEINKLPSESDLKKMLVKDIITHDLYIDTLINKGYSPAWAEKLDNLVE